MKLYLNKYLTYSLKGVYYKHRNKEKLSTERKYDMDNMELKKAMKELKKAKGVLEKNGYQRKLVYKLTYLKDNTWESIYFDNKDEAYTMINAMHEINAKVSTYSYITVNRWSWEMFIEP